MTYAKAVQALIDAGLLNPPQAKPAITALDRSNVEFTYSAWAQALVAAGLISAGDAGTAADVMEKAGWVEADDDPDAFDQGLEDAEIA